MSMQFTSPELTEQEVQDLLIPNKKIASKDRQLAAPGTYLMKARNFGAKRFGANNTVKGVLFLTHASPENFEMKGVELELWKSKENPNRNSSVTQKYLSVLGKALGLSVAQIATMTWAYDDEAVADDFGKIPAAIAIADETGSYTPISVEGAIVEAVIDIDTYPKDDGKVGRRNVIKSITLPSVE